MDIRDVAWAAGLFEAEGSITHHLPTGRKTHRPTLDVSQRGDGSAPAVLVRFRDVVGGGSLFGPYRGYLYYWRTHDAGLITSVVMLLWPWIGVERQGQIRATLGAVPALWSAETLGEVWAAHVERRVHAEEARAWAGGFFEGDGSIGAYQTRGRETYGPTLSASISQASTAGVPTCLTRFREVIGIGSIRGPIAPRGWSRLPQYRWEARGRAVGPAMAPLLPWLVGPKRDQVQTAISRAGVPSVP
jgi:hypothetical protein